MTLLTEDMLKDLSDNKPLYDLLHIDCNSFESEYLEGNKIIEDAKRMYNHPKEWGGIYDTINALFNNGPLTAGDLPSKSAKAVLVQYGYCTMIVVKGEDGNYALNMKGYYLFKIFEYMIAESKKHTAPGMFTMTIDVTKVDNVYFAIYDDKIITLQSILNWLDKTISDKVTKSVGVTQYISGIICDFTISNYEVTNNKLIINCNFTLGKECTALTDKEKISILADSENLYLDIVTLNTMANLYIDMDSETFINGRYKMPICGLRDITMVQVINNLGNGVFSKPPKMLDIMAMINNPKSSVGWQ